MSAEAENRERWLRAVYSGQVGRRLGKLIMNVPGWTIWQRTHAWFAVQCVMFYVAAFPEGPPDASE